MEFFQNKKRDIAIIVGVCVVLFGALIVAPKLYNTGVKVQQKSAHSTIKVNISNEERKRLETEIEGYKKQIAANDKKGAPNFAVVYAKMAHDYEGLGQLARAEDAYTQALKENPTHEEALYGRADVRKEMEQFGDAEKDYRAAIEANPTNPENYQRLAVFYQYALKDEERAKGVYIDGLSKTKSNLVLMKHFATYLETVGNTYEAYLYWQAIAKKNPKDTDASARVKVLQPLVKDVIKAAEDAAKKKK